MNNALEESALIFSSIFNDTQQKEIIEIIKDIYLDEENYLTKRLWEFDQKIGSVGGYCMGCDPGKSNPFQGTEDRPIFRPLQYIRSEIDINNIYDNSRNIIANCGLHLEGVIKRFLFEKKILGSIRYSRKTLGETIKVLEKNNYVSNDIIYNLKLILSLYNDAKHDVYSRDDRTRLFIPEDAITCYFASRIIGKNILILLEHPRAKDKYEIDWRKFGRTVKHF